MIKEEVCLFSVRRDFVYVYVFSMKLVNDSFSNFGHEHYGA